MTLVGFKAQNHPQQARKDHVDDMATTPDLFQPLSDRFGGFTIDVAAAMHNTKCERFYSLADNGLAHTWAGERVWCNPPYSDIGPWVRKAWHEWRTGCDLVVMLLPANRCEQSWWQDWIEPYRDRPSSPLTAEFLRGRHRFLRAGQERVGANERPPFGCVLAIWQHHGPPLELQEVLL